MYPLTTLSRLALTRAAALALTLASATTLASAGTPVVTPVGDAPLAASPVQLVETPKMDVATLQPTPCRGAESEDALYTPVAVDPSDLPSTSQSPRPRRGYCRCSCSFTPDCSTNADCGGSLCLKGPTCC